MYNVSNSSLKPLTFDYVLVKFKKINAENQLNSERMIALTNKLLNKYPLNDFEKLAADVNLMKSNKKNLTSLNLTDSFLHDAVEKACLEWVLIARYKAQVFFSTNRNVQKPSSRTSA